MKVIGITILVLIALFTGGCSLFFLVVAATDYHPIDSLGFFGVPAGVGLIICFFSVLWIRHLSRSGPALPPQSPDPAPPE